MEDLYNTRLKRIERNVAGSEVQDKILSGAYDFLGGPQSKVFINTGTGDPLQVPSHTAAKYIRMGAQYLTPVMVQQMRENNEFADSPLGAISALATGVDKYGFAGGGSRVLEGMGFIPEGRTEAIEAKNPWLHHPAGIVASILATLATGPVAGSARAGVATTQATRLAATAAQNAAARTATASAASSIAKTGIGASKKVLEYSLPGIGAKLGRAAEGKVNQMLMQHGSKFIPSRLADPAIAQMFGPHAAKIAAATVGAGIEGGVWGTGQGISEAIIGEPGESAEHILDTVQDNILMGMAFGGAISGITPFIAGAKGAGVNIVDKVAGSKIGGKAMGKVTAASSAYISRVAKEAGLPPETVAWLKRATASGDDTLIRELQGFKENMDISAREVARVFNILRMTDQFVQISDINGLKMDTLLDAVEATNQGRAVHFDIGSVFDEDAALGRLKGNLKAKRDAYQASLTMRDPGVQARRDALLVDIEDLDGQVSRRESDLRRSSHVGGQDLSDISIPGSAKEVMDNVAVSYSQARKALVGMLGKESVAEAGGAVSRLIKDINNKEADLYLQMFSDDNLAKAKAALRAKGVAQALTPAERSFYTIVSTRLGVLSGFVKAGRDLMEDAVKKAPPGFSYDRGGLAMALHTAESTGDFYGIIQFIETFPVGQSREAARRIFGMSSDMKSFRGHSVARAKNTFTKKGTVDATNNRIAGMDQSFATLQHEVHAAISRIRKLDVADRDGVAKEGATRGVLDFDGDSGQTLREIIDEHLYRLDYHASDPDITAKAFKSLEDIQTTVLKHLQYGSLPETVKITEKVKEEVIALLRNEMYRSDRWGQMAVIKEAFDLKAKKFSKLNDQVISGLTGEVGMRTPGDPAAFLSLLRNLDMSTVDLKLERINEYGDAGRELLDFIRRNFDPVDADNLPIEMRRSIKNRLADIDDTMERMNIQGDMMNPHAGWDHQMSELVEFSRRTSDSLGDSLGEIKAKIPIADALLSDSARNRNLGNLISDVGRGGAVSLLAHAVTGSGTIAALAGLGVGMSSMALSPERYLGLMQQLAILKRTNKKIIKDYMDDWARDTVPAAAIANEWEKSSRSMLMVAGQGYQRDTREARTAIRRKAAKDRHIDSWSERINEALNSELTEDSFFEVSQSIGKLASSPTLMERYTHEITRVFEGMPDIRKSMREVIARKIQIANRLIPKASQGPAFSDPIPPTSFQLQEFGRHLQVLNSPKDTILTAMLSGTLTADMVKTLQEAWPIIYSEVVEAAINAISDPSVRNNLTQAQRIVLSTLTGSSMLALSENMRLHEQYKKEDEGQGQGRQQRRPRGPVGGGMRDTVNTGTTTTSIVERQ